MSKKLCFCATQTPRLNPLKTASKVSDLSPIATTAHVSVYVDDTVGAKVHNYICFSWITIKVPNGQIRYKMKCIRKHQIWYEIVTCGLRDICTKCKSTTPSVYQDIHIKQGHICRVTYNSWRCNFKGNCALVYQTISILIKLNVFISSQVRNNKF